MIHLRLQSRRVLSKAVIPPQPASISGAVLYPDINDVKIVFAPRQTAQILWLAADPLGAAADANYGPVAVPAGQTQHTFVDINPGQYWPRMQSTDGGRVSAIVTAAAAVDVNAPPVDNPPETVTCLAKGPVVTSSHIDVVFHQLADVDQDLAGVQALVDSDGTTDPSAIAAGGLTNPATAFPAMFTISAAVCKQASPAAALLFSPAAPSGVKFIRLRAFDSGSPVNYSEWSMPLRVTV